MLGGRRGSYRPRRHSVIYMWISAPNNFSHCLPPLFGLHPLHVRNSMSFSYRLLLSSLMSTLSFATFFCLFAGFMSNSFMYDTQWITWNWLLPHITISFHRQKKKNDWHFTQPKFTSAFLTKANYVQLCSVLSFLHMLGYCGEELTLLDLKYLNLMEVVHCTRGKKEYHIFSCVLMCSPVSVIKWSSPRLYSRTPFVQCWHVPIK